MTSRKRKIEDALARIAEANGVKEMTMTQGKWVPERLTEDMYATFLRAREYESSADDTWKALLAAAPSIPAERDAQRLEEAIALLREIYSGEHRIITERGNVWQRTKDFIAAKDAP